MSATSIFPRKRFKKRCPIQATPTSDERSASNLDIVLDERISVVRPRTFYVASSSI